MKKGSRTLFFILISSFLLFFICCSRSAIEIEDVSWTPVLVLSESSEVVDSLSIVERLSVFVSLKNNTQKDIISSLIIKTPVSYLHWDVTVDDFEIIKIGENFWIGSNSLYLPTGKKLASGKYSIQIGDIYGNYDETSFLFDHSGIPESYEELVKILPVISIAENNDSIVINNAIDFPVMLQGFIDKNDKTIGSVNLHDGVYKYSIILHEIGDKATFIKPIYMNPILGIQIEMPLIKTTQ